MKYDTPRAARKKLLLLEGTLHRLEVLEAKEALRASTAKSFVGQRLPGIIAFLIQHKAGALLTSVLPLLLGAGRLSRVARRGTLLLGAGAAVMGFFNRWTQSRPLAEPQRQEPAAAVTTAESADKKNPG